MLAPGQQDVGPLVVHLTRSSARDSGWRLYQRLPHRAQAQLAWARRQLRHRRGHDHVLGRDLPAAARRWTECHLARLQPSVVIFDTPFMSVASPPGVKRVLLAHDVLSQRAASLRSGGYLAKPAGLDAAWEQERLSSMDAIVSIQWDDAAVLREMAPGAATVVAPPTFDVHPTWSKAEPTLRCLLVGSGSLHNVDGARWLLQEVWPIVRRSLPLARLDVVGSVSSQLSGPLQGVTLHGEVPSLLHFYEQAQLVLVPLRVGSGLKVKLVEGLCFGRPIITTPVGAQGFTAFKPQPFVVASSATCFSAAILRLLQDLSACNELEDASRSAARRFSSGGAHLEFLRLLDASA